MNNGELTESSKALLRALHQLEQRHQVATVHAAANAAGLTFMESYDLVNTLFTSGHITHDLRVTDTGRKAASL